VESAYAGDQVKTPPDEPKPHLEWKTSLTIYFFQVQRNLRRYKLNRGYVMIVLSSDIEQALCTLMMFCAKRLIWITISRHLLSLLLMECMATLENRRCTELIIP
jgi:hypothetical protein